MAKNIANDLRSIGVSFDEARIVCEDGKESSQNLPSSERHIPGNPRRRVGAVGTTAGHHHKTRNVA